MPKLCLPKLLIGLCFMVFFFSACKKAGSNTGSRVEKLFEENVLNKDFVVAYATNNGTDLTANYNGYTFVLLKTDYYHGDLQAKKDGAVITGSWSTNDDYSKLIITLPETPSDFIFLSREWRFTKKSVPLLKLAPWGTSEPLVLHMLRR